MKWSKSFQDILPLNSDNVFNNGDILMLKKRWISLWIVPQIIYLWFSIFHTKNPTQTLGKLPCHNFSCNIYIMGWNIQVIGNCFYRASSKSWQEDCSLGPQSESNYHMVESTQAMYRLPSSHVHYPVHEYCFW